MLRLTLIVANVKPKVFQKLGGSAVQANYPQWVAASIAGTTGEKIGFCSLKEPNIQVFETGRELKEAVTQWTPRCYS